MKKINFKGECLIEIDEINSKAFLLKYSNPFCTIQAFSLCLANFIQNRNRK